MTIKIDDLIPLLEPGWVAMDKYGFWYWFKEKPTLINGVWTTDGIRYVYLSTIAFSIELAEDWKKSLRKVG